ncbi:MULTISPECIES: type I secretion system permease/ATPase [unclassified Shinella]|jgi:PrtD family type I secretion system ABC transporter|uniref:type I secretion system permease/ATPase n=1 Tax=unclassified Shinella TaxID=2643062 RepID=UPI0003C545DB|nr:MULTISPECIES: type I secretion system permease/ATPase [unclassified Shinella]MCA0344206.1 type I secretion system permease/ATPase [Pseudomonadota bacterium]EYR79197.1 type I secretion system ABC transporter, PrtD family [Shinella sp. DD12]KNY17543.1 peptide ABC transporter ATPase [Shinella sp. SUS2]KOC75005.1 peptide ABC transporter ATPase [Shinella sp. GWS1]MCO5150285.1 type I secretion system permease/ATPase [Shinella sp.]
MRPSGKAGVEELRAALKSSAAGFLAIGLFSFFVNLLVLTGPLFMLQIYDRVLSSRSEATLVALTGLIIGLYLVMGVLDHIRSRVAARIGARFQARFDKRVFNAVLDRTNLHAQGISTVTGMRDLDSIQKVLSSPALFTVFDIPWTPFFLFVIFTFHPWMGMLGVVGGLILVGLTWLNQNGTKEDQERAMIAGRLSDEMTQTLQKESDTVRALGMRRAVAGRWQLLRDKALEANIRYSDSNGFYSISSKTFRVFLQSAILALGAYLVLQNEITAGAMIASSIIIGRALAPIEGAIGQWSLIQRAMQGWRNLSQLLARVPEEDARTALPKPRAVLEVEQVTVVPPGEQVATLRMLNLELHPGQALGVIGQSASGKSTLARVLTGIWPPAAGKVRLDGASLEQYGTDGLADHVGYLPQDVVLFEGTVAENIARMALDPDPVKVVEAARKAGAHDMILRLPDGYDTKLPAMGGRLSGGQKQRVGLARALYGDPVLVVLDEPNSNLDAEGSMALNLAIRNMKAEGKSVVIMAHRPAAIEECELILIMENGQRLAFGPRDDVLRAHLRNHTQVVAGTGGSNK